ncbi:MAG: DUF4307 domain-containing protein [Actinobacteria bacterium]|nr:DUF4307 domain-containing protein [Actinomycetota bacterium]
MQDKQAEILSERYGVNEAPRKGSNKVLGWVAVIVATVLAGLFGFLNWSPIGTTDIGFRVLSPWQTEVDFEIQMPVGSVATCGVEAINNSFTQVGYVYLELGPFEQSTTRHTVSINTYQEAVTGLVDECTLR